MITSKQYEDALKVIAEYDQQVKEELLIVERVKRKLANIIVPSTCLIHMKKVSARTFRCIVTHFHYIHPGDITLKMISELSERNILTKKNIGIQTVKEITDILSKAGLKLKEEQTDDLYIGARVKISDTASSRIKSAYTSREGEVVGESYNPQCLNVKWDGNKAPTMHNKKFLTLI